jgi:sec-independent protein translocase protein TatA
MNILGIGPIELFLVLILALIIFGPKDLEKAGRSIGSGLRKLTKSESYRTVAQTSEKLRSLPTDLMREAHIDELQQTLAPLQGDLHEIKHMTRKPSSERLGESWLAAPGDPPAETVASTFLGMEK